MSEQAPAARAFSDAELLSIAVACLKHARQLRITEIRVERLQEISYEDAVAEGCGMPDMRFEPIGEGETWEQTARRLRWPQRSYQQLWGSINGADSWAANPWVWALTFEVIKANVDQVMRRQAA